jgi:uncharacterized protein
MSLPAYLRIQGGMVFLHVKVQPRASRTGIGEQLGSELKIKVTAPPVDSAANVALIEFLAQTLDCPRNAIQIVRGETSRHKVLSIHGLAPQAVAQRLDPGKHD